MENLTSEPKYTKAALENPKAGKMKALVYHGPGHKSWEEKPCPELLLPTDVILRIISTTICGTDLHILKGDVPEVTDGRILGHEGVGVVQEIGDAVVNFQKGDHVIISCITSCGKCAHCKKGMLSHCQDGGWLLGHFIDGTQAEYVRIPHADNSLQPLPWGADEDAMVMLSDILPTGFECGVLKGKVKPGDTIAILGAGPIGLAVLLTADLYSPLKVIVVDIDDNRLDTARQFGATHTLNSLRENIPQRITELTGGKGVDTAIEAVGIPATFELCTMIVGPGGHVANIGVHGKSATLHLEALWSQNITITTALVDTSSTPLLLRTVEAKKIEPSKLITHYFNFDEMLKAYEVFSNAGDEKALKVIVRNNANVN